MKKTPLFSAALGLVSYGGDAQIYTFSQRVGSYSDLRKAKDLTAGLTWDDPRLTIPLGFNFMLHGNAINTLFLYDGLGGMLETDTTFSGFTSIILPYAADLVDRGFNINLGSGQKGGLSPISYVTEGTVGNRISKIQWKNAGFYGELEARGTSSDFVNFQLWFYEASNIIEYHYGPNLMAKPSLCFDGLTGPIVGLLPQYDNVNDHILSTAYFLSGNPSSATLDHVTSVNAPPSLNALIPNSTIYSFEPSSGLNENKRAIQLDLYSEEKCDFIRLTNKSVESFKTIEITDENEQLVKTLNYTDKIDISNLSKGPYSLTLKGSNSQHSQKFLKK